MAGFGNGIVKPSSTNTMLVHRLFIQIRAYRKVTKYK